jgi:hypothetical protein
MATTIAYSLLSFIVFFVAYNSGSHALRLLQSDSGVQQATVRSQFTNPRLSQRPEEEDAA